MADEGERDSTPDQDQELEELFALYVEQLNRGQKFHRQEILAKHPRVGEELLQCLEEYIDSEFAPADSIEPLGTLGDYTLRRQIGRGGMGVVYEAWENSMDRRVALKVLPAGIAADDRAVTRFVREARLSGKLNHPNVVAVYGMGVKEQTPYYAMEFVEGDTLAKILLAMKAAAPEDETPFGKKDHIGYFATLAGAFADVADGLQHAHSKHVVHRDIKPSNLILDSERRLRILDFGLARLEGQESLTVSGGFIGTPAYMSPEQARRRTVPVDHRTDVYSLGATMYEALAGRPPFTGDDHQETLRQVIEREPVPPKKWNPRVPKDLETIVLRCLLKEPQDRYGTAEALAQDLRRFVRADPIEARPVPEWERALRRGWRMRRQAAVAGIVLLLLIASVLLFEHHRDAAERRLRETYRDEVIAGVMRLQLAEMTIRAGSGDSGAISTQGLFRKGDFEALAKGMGLDPIREGLERLGAAIEKSPSRPEAYYHRARGLALLGRRAEAIADLDRALEVSADFVPAGALKRTLLGRSSPAPALAGDRERAPLASTDWQSLWLRAREDLAAGSWEGAAAAYQGLVAFLDGGEGPFLGASIECYLGLGIARFNARDLPGALESFVAARTLWPRAPEPQLLAGMVYLEQDDIGRAARAFDLLYSGRDVIKEDVALWVTALFKYYKKYGEGWTWAQRVSEESIRLRLELSFANLLGRAADAIRLGREAIRRSPRDQGLHHTLAVALLERRGNEPEALQVARRAHELDPDRVSTICLLAAAHAQSGEAAPAEALLRTAIAKDPVEPRAYDQLGQLLFHRGELAEAERLYLQAIEIVERNPRRLPNVLDPMNNWGWTLLMLGRVSEGAAMFERSIAAFPELPYAPVNLGWLLKLEGDLPRALAMCDRAIANAPGRSRAHRERGLVLWMMGDRPAAVASLREAVRLHPTNEDAQACLAWAREGAGQLRESLEECIEGLEADPRQAWAHRHLIHLQHPLAAEVSLAPLWERAVRALQGEKDEGDASPTRIAALAVARLRAAEGPGAASALRLAGECATVTDDPYLEAARAAALRAAGKMTEAVRTLETASRMGRVPRFVAEQLAAYRRLSPPDPASLESPPAPPGVCDVAPRPPDDPPAGVPLRIDCGGDGFVDAAGRRWGPDRFFHGGVARSSPRMTVRDEQDPELFRTARLFPADELFAEYRIPLSPGRYQVTLHVAQMDLFTRFPSRFDVRIEGQRVLENVGPRGFAKAGAHRADIDVRDGVLEIVFEPVDDDPVVSGIEVVRIP